ncbi:MAG: hypothetical protein Q4E33_04405 [Erysipelotrichaceae bacterium]|nr:hypothetical protein [Erysipelotrichaceae bacterium]
MLEEKKIIELNDEETKQVTGGVDYGDSDGYKYNGYNVVNSDWGKPCRKYGLWPSPVEGFRMAQVQLCYQCKHYKELPEPINGWDGYCERND